MTIIKREQRLLMRAYWMVSHRWLAIVSVAALAWIGPQVFDINVQTKPLYLISIGLLVENFLTLLILKLVKQRQKEKLYNAVRLVIHFQIICDLVFLTSILHFIGGIENPLFLIYYFHMVIASILLSRTGAFLQTTLALLFFGCLVFLEYHGSIKHHCLCLDGAPNHELYKEPYFVIRTYVVFAFTSYILVYLATSIGHRLRSQEDKLTGAIEQLRVKDEIKNTYVLRITHDIKSHLAAIQTNLAVLSEGVFGKLEGKNREFLDRAYNRTQTLTNFARNLLQITQLRLENKIGKKTFSLNAVITKVVSDRQEELDEKNLKLYLDLDEEAYQFTGNKNSMFGVFQNLIGNAIKYCKEGGEITIRSTDDQTNLCIEICDNGIGIPEDEISSIFSEFYRGSNVKGTGIQGSGVGLSLVKEIILRHGGTISATQINPAGSCFTILLPKQ